MHPVGHQLPNHPCVTTIVITGGKNLTSIFLKIKSIINHLKQSWWKNLQHQIISVLTLIRRSKWKRIFDRKICVWILEEIQYKIKCKFASKTNSQIKIQAININIWLPTSKFLNNPLVFVLWIQRFEQKKKITLYSVKKESRIQSNQYQEG